MSFSWMRERPARPAGNTVDGNSVVYRTPQLIVIVFNIRFPFGIARADFCFSYTNHYNNSMKQYRLCVLYIIEFGANSIIRLNNIDIKCASSCHLASCL